MLDPALTCAYCCEAMATVTGVRGETYAWCPRCGPKVRRRRERLQMVLLLLAAIAFWLAAGYGVVTLVL